MKANFEYDYKYQPMDSVSIEDIGNCCLSASNDIGEFYFFISRSVLGVTRILEYGPFKDGSFPLHAEYAFEQFDYNEKRLYNKIEKFLNHPKRVITQVQETTYDEIEDKIIDLKRYMYG